MPSFDALRMSTEDADWHLADTHQEKLSFSSVSPVDVHIRQLNVSVEPPAYKSWFANKKLAADEEKAAPKRILADINADFLRGSLTGIVGSSGSGKTTLLNVLSHRMRSRNLNINGQLFYNDSSSLSSVTHAYVTQTDVLLPTLTVRETLMYAADLRLPSSTTKAERARLVEEIILELGLKECASTSVGDGFRRRGCSGGERRRVSIGVQMLGNPSVLFLDEPTTGLDATSAFQLVKTLKGVAERGRTIIMTLHQPRSEVFFMLHRVTLLAQGRVLYTGPVAEATSWFETLLPPLPPHVNPADYLIDAAAIDVRTIPAEKDSRARVQKLTVAWQEHSSNLFSPVKRESDASIDQVDVPDHSMKAPIQRTVRTLVSRTFKTSFRDPLGLTTFWIEAVLMGVTVGLVFLQLPESLSGIRSRQAAVYTAVGLQGYLIVMFEVYRLSVIEMPIFDREHGEGVVGVLPWIISHRLSHFVLEDVIVPFIFAATTYWIIGLTPDAVRFFVYFAVVFLSQLTSVTFAGLAVALSRDFATSALAANLAFTVHSFACGFFVQADYIPIWLRWLKWITQVFYGFTALVYNEFNDRFYDCPDGEPRTDPACVSYRGDFIIGSLAVPRVGGEWRIVPLCAILGFAVIYFLLTILLLHLKKVDITMLGQKQRPVENKEKQVSIKSRGDNTVQGVDVGLTDYSLRIRNRGGNSLTILDNITTHFEAGKVNVILGPSGSGKSSLLNLMAQRLQSTWRTTYEAEGELALNGVAADGSLIKSLCSYVTQDDAALLPYLTVRETLRFSAGLRLPNTFTKEEKLQKADEVLDKMGLRDCAETLVGGELKKGISGGEKRRVSIAIQVLTEPQVLMLDEPTSGLDAFTAGSIMDVLNQLAHEGRTIITTLHQSSSELFKHFGNVLLLAKGGRVAYAGPGPRMLDYMASVGFKCPSTMNPADFALDVVSVDLREAAREEVSRAKVDKLVTAFKSVSQPKRDFAGKTPPTSLKEYEKKMSALVVSFPILLHRGWLGTIRQPEVINARLGNVLGLGIVSAIFFSPLGNDYVSAIQNRIGCIQEILPLYFVGMLVNVAVYPIERDIFYREYDDGAYSIESFFMSYLFLELPGEILSCLMFAALAAIATNLRRTIGFYFIVTLNSIAIVNAGESLGIIFNTIFNDNTGLALNVTNVLLSVSNFMAGLMSVDQPAFFKGLNKISPLGYAVNNLVPYSYRGQTFTCNDDQRLPNGSCVISTGEQVLEIYNLDKINAPLNLGAIVITAVIYRLLAYAVLKASKAKFRVRRNAVSASNS